MKAIILAAGKGSRISHEIGDMPKSILPLKDGTPIIRRSVVQMLECGIKPVVCTGYKREMLREALKGLDVTYYDNPFYEVTNNIASLWFALSEFGDEDMLLTSADLYYPKELLLMLKNRNAEIVMAVDSSKSGAGDYYINVGDDGIITDYGPNIPVEERQYEYMGLIKISASMVPAIKEKVNEYVTSGQYDKYFENIFWTSNIQDKLPIFFNDVAGFFWMEFDYYSSYKKILEHENNS